MSEYQYYEFQAIDRPLSDKEIKEVRAYSTRAEITRHSFINEYSYGDFKGNVGNWMVKYFDAFIYYANWGTHIFKLSFPTDLLDFTTVKSYCQGSSNNLEVFKKNDKIILSFLKVQNKTADHQVEKKRRSVGELRTEAKHIAKKRVKQETEKEAEEKERKEKEHRLAREMHLNTLKGREAILWQQIEDLINRGTAISYKKAIALLIDLSDLAKQGNDDKFQVKLSDLRNRHEHRRSFIQSLNLAGLK